ncbi:hypothetical protein KI387_028357, partial [Taxus chinensis]
MDECSRSLAYPKPNRTRRFVGNCGDLRVMAGGGVGKENKDPRLVFMFQGTKSNIMVGKSGSADSGSYSNKTRIRLKIKGVNGSDITLDASAATPSEEGGNVQ